MKPKTKAKNIKVVGCIAKLRNKNADDIPARKDLNLINV